MNDTTTVYTEKYAAINAYEGGYLITCDGTQIITTSLNKAIKLVRDHFNGPTVLTEGE